MAKTKEGSWVVAFRLTEKEIKLARQLSKRERRDGGSSVNLWAREVLRQYLHEYRVMPQAWGNGAVQRKR